ncbi:hypothetical protein RN001_016071 [Aquatica leii]|uniref:Actin-related protein 5 n=1 Tax=Aquatica leii TaxID=1421715 RepID=A0AAN7NX38_9COLE|nr:hypothetical protein RN001_016071 [Aquatica leii]
MEVLQFKDLKPTPDIIHAHGVDQHNATIIIDNGSYQCRVGWLNQREPLLIFRNLIAKPRKERTKKDAPESSQTPQLQIGNDITNIEAVRFQLKTQFDRNVVTHFEAQEHLFDYTFTHLGIDTETCVAHPVVITEPFLNPTSSRQLMSELLFECYGVPSLAYGIDGVYAYHFAQSKSEDSGLIVSLGYHTIHIIPIINNKTIFVNTRRINTGGYHVISFLHRILQLKYPAHANAITLSRAEELLHSICAVALDYKEELNRWTDTDYYENNIRKIQLPYTTTTTSTLTLEQQKERKRELAKRLAEINAKKREERLAEDEEKLNSLLAIQEMIEVDEDCDEIDQLLTDHQIKSVDELNKNITALNLRIEKTKEKITASTSNEDVVVDEIPVKQAKISKMVFENEKAMHTYVQNAKKMRQDILNKKTARKQRRQDMAKRRTAAGQERMRIISQLARKEKGNDDFGLRDEDWDIYKTISREGGDSDSEIENEKLLELEEIIRTHEPSEVDETAAPGESHQLHIGIERYRSPELLFKPYMMGSSEAGLTEVIGYVLSLFSPEEQLLLAGNVVLTGGLANLPGLRERIEADLVSIRPFQTYSNVKIIPNPSLAGWYGTRKWARSSEFKRNLITRRQYEEYGSEYFKVHIASNIYVATPKGHNIDICE